MLHKIRTIGKGISGLGVGITFISYYQSIKDEKLRKNYDSLLQKHMELENLIANSKYDAVTGQYIDDKLSSLSSTFSSQSSSISETVNKLKNSSADTPKSTMDYHLNELIKNTTNSNKTLDDILSVLNEWTGRKNITGSPGGGNGDLFSTIKAFMENYSNMLNNLDLEQLGALFHLLASLFILFFLFSIIVVTYNELFLNYFKLEEKYPKLAYYIKLRRKFQQYYLFLNFILIIITLCSIIFINYTRLF
uniref:LAGLIDADG endonuclease n=1 Tax=Sphaerobolus stellatus TaxID=68786 RepID=A0A7D4V5A1_9AGAM|nr:LAGLIDADG endonuclease [Sphaerobolus stellatus]